MNQCINEWSNESMNEWINESQNYWIKELMNQWFQFPLVGFPKPRRNMRRPQAGNPPVLTHQRYFWATLLRYCAVQSIIPPMTSIRHLKCRTPCDVHVTPKMSHSLWRPCDTLHFNASSETWRRRWGWSGESRCDTHDIILPMTSSWHLKCGSPMTSLWRLKYYSSYDLQNPIPTAPCIWDIHYRTPMTST